MPNALLRLFMRTVRNVPIVNIRMLGTHNAAFGWDFVQGIHKLSVSLCAMRTVSKVLHAFRVVGDELPYRDILFFILVV